jgi:hypothetical protein
MPVNPMENAFRTKKEEERVALEKHRFCIFARSWSYSPGFNHVFKPGSSL